MVHFPTAAERAANLAILRTHHKEIVAKGERVAVAAKRPTAGKSSVLDNSPRTALLHWCDDTPHHNVISGLVRAGKLVRMRADWLAGYGEPILFTVHEDASLIRTILDRLGRQRRTMNPFPTVATVVGQQTMSSDAWRANVSELTGQNRYYFTDERRQESGLLVVTATGYGVTGTGVVLDGCTVKLPFNVTIKLTGFLGRRKTLTHEVIAAKDPTLRVELLTTAGQDRSLLDHVRNLAQEVQTLSRQDNRDDEADPPVEDNVLIEMADRYLNRVPAGLLRLSDDSREITVDEERPASINVEIQPPEGADPSFRTAYALRLTNTENPEDFVISGIVLVGGDENSIEVRG